MPRPATLLDALNSQVGNWDQTVDDNNDTLRSLLFIGPYPMITVHRSAASEGSVPLFGFPSPGFDPALFAFCTVMVVDALNSATNGHMIYSDGTDWRYQRTHTIVII